MAASRSFPLPSMVQMIVHFNTLATLYIHEKISSQDNCIGIYIVNIHDHHFLHIIAKTRKLHHQPNNITHGLNCHHYFALVVDDATLCCFYESHNIVVPPIVPYCPHNVFHSLTVSLFNLHHYIKWPK